jgi:predicted O-methyltransferase YrrM
MPKKLRHASSILARRVQKYARRWAAQYWHDDPFCGVPLASAATYEALWQKAKTESFAEVDTFEVEAGYALPQEWLHDLALHTQIVIKNSSLCYQHGRILYSALRTYLARTSATNINILETGTARGFSSTVMARALADAQAAGRIFTLDLLPHDVPMYWNCIDDHAGRKTRRALLQPWVSYTSPSVIYLEGDSRTTLPALKMDRIHFAFLDGAHTYQDVLFEVAHVVPFQKTGDVIVFDDYSTQIFPGLVQAVDVCCARDNYSKQVLHSKDHRAYVIAIKN